MKGSSIPGTYNMVNCFVVSAAVVVTSAAVVAASVAAASVVAATSAAGLQPASDKDAIMDMPSTIVTNHNNDFFIFISFPVLLLKQILIKSHTRFVCFWPTYFTSKR
jgi:hypothetical protein